MNDYIDQFLPASMALSRSEIQCWRFWYSDGGELISPYSVAVDGSHRELREWKNSSPTSLGPHGFSYVKGLVPFIAGMREADFEHRNYAVAEDGAAIVAGQVVPRNIVGPDPSAGDQRTFHGMVFRARTLTIKRQVVLDPGRHEQGKLMSRLMTRYLVPVNRLSIWDETGWL